MILEGGIPMPILSPSDQEYLRELFAERLRDPVTIRLFTQRLAAIKIPGYDCLTCRETNELLQEVAALSDKLTLEIYDFLQDAEKARQENVEEIPSIILYGHNKGTVRFIGVPAGYEFMTLIEDLIDVSRGTTELSPLSRETLAKFSQPVHIKVLVTPTCPYCPSVARLAHMMAIESDKVIADVIEVSEFPHIAQRYRVYGVPKVVINESLEFEGARPEAAFVAMVESVAGPAPAGKGEDSA